MADKHHRLVLDTPSSPLPRLGSFDELNSTYASEGFRINSWGLRMDGDISEKVERVLRDQIHHKDLTILEELGRGASAVVRKAITRTGETFVVKCFNIYDESKRKMLKDEIHILIELDDDSVVRFHGAYLDEDQRVCMILEYMDRGSVEDLVNYCRRINTRIPERVLAAMTFQIVWGLNYLNFQGFMHRDIKPPNLLINSEGKLKVTDFGIGKRTHEASTSSEHFYDEDAKGAADGEDDPCAQTFVGTRIYMSPERLQGDPYGFNADVWSLGIVLAEEMLGHHPLSDHSDNFADLVMTLRGLPGGTLGTVIPDGIDYSDSLIDFVSWCLAVDPLQRVHARQLLDDRWFEEQLGACGVNPELFDESVDIVRRWMDAKVPQYQGPSPPAGASSKAGAFDEDADDKDGNFETLPDSDDDDLLGATGDMNLQTLQSDSDDDSENSADIQERKSEYRLQAKD